MDRNAAKRPLGVTIIGCVYVLVGVAGFVAHFASFRLLDTWEVELTEFLAALSGAFMLRGQNWARWLAVAWIAFHVALSFGSLREVVIHSVFLVAIAWVLFGAGSRRYFRRASIEVA